MSGKQRSKRTPCAQGGVHGDMGDMDRSDHREEGQSNKKPKPAMGGNNARYHVSPVASLRCDTYSWGVIVSLSDVGCDARRGVVQRRQTPAVGIQVFMYGLHHMHICIHTCYVRHARWSSESPTMYFLSCVRPKIRDFLVGIIVCFVSYGITLCEVRLNYAAWQCTPSVLIIVCDVNKQNSPPGFEPLFLLHDRSTVYRAGDAEAGVPCPRKQYIK